MRLLFILLAFLVLAPSAAPAQTAFSEENAARILRDLSVGIGPRPMGSPAEQRALEYARSKFAASGCDTSYILPMNATSRANTTSGIAVGIRRGATGRSILIGGHLDSAGPEIPGADDDGSGSAVVMEAARVLGQRRMQSTLVFCCFGGEEEGLQGSRYFVEHFPGLDSVALMLQVDMANGLGTIDIDPDTYEQSAPRWLVRAAVEEFSALGYQGLRYPTHFFSLNYALKEGSGSDHESFLAKGIPAIDFSTDVAKPIHTPRDNFENFDVRGLRRTGDLVLKLVDRFDGGTPGRSTERYWLYLVGDTPVFLPLWALWLFGAAAAGTAVAALARLRARRLRKDDPGYASWSSLKIYLVSLLIIGAGWCSSDLVGLAGGIRHPWFTAITLYGIFGILCAGLAAWLAVRFIRFRITECPYPLVRSASILLVLLTGLGSLLSPKLITEPGAALLLASMAMLIRQPAMRAVLLLVSPLWLMRLVFSEWSGMFFRVAGLSLPGSAGAALIANLVMVGLLSVLLLPFFLGVVALWRDAPALQKLGRVFLRPAALAAGTAAFLLLGALLLTLPPYNRLWYRDVRVEERYDMGTGVKSIEVRSSEYLSGMRLRHGGADSSIAGRITRAEIVPAQFDTTWVRLGRTAESATEGSSTRFSVKLTVHCALRPLTVVVRYAGAGGSRIPIRSPWMTSSSGGAETIEWRHYPDSLLTIPVEFSAAQGDSVTETVEVTFDRLADPVDIAHEMSYVIPRTTYTATKVYRKGL